MCCGTPYASFANERPLRSDLIPSENGGWPATVPYRIQDQFRPPGSDTKGINEQSAFSITRRHRCTVVCSHWQAIASAGLTMPTGNGSSAVTPRSPPPPDLLVEAADLDVTFTTGGDADWFSQRSTYYSGGDAAQSGDISDSEESWMQSSVEGEGTLTFWWKVSSESGCDELEFYLDDVLKHSISGEVDWQQKSYNVTGSGSHTLKWRYVEDSSASDGSDCGWVDCLQWSESPGACQDWGIRYNTWLWRHWKWHGRSLGMMSWQDLPPDCKKTGHATQNARRTIHRARQRGCMSIFRSAGASAGTAGSTPCRRRAGIPADWSGPC